MKYSKDKRGEKSVKSWKERYLGEVLTLVFHKNNVLFGERNLLTYSRFSLYYFRTQVHFLIHIPVENENIE